MGLVADGNNLGLGIGDAAGVKLLTADAVDNMSFWISNSWLRHRADDVDLVIFPWLISSIDINNVVSVVQPEHRVGSVPVNVVDLAGGH